LAGIHAKRRVLDFVSLFLLAEQLLIPKMGDRYLIVFLPFACIALGHYLAHWLNRLWVVTGAACLIMLGASLLWSRGLLEQEEAVWKGGQALLAAGAQPAEIFGSHAWNCYHGKIVDDYLAALGDAKLESTKDFWSRWYPERWKRARFLITDSSVAPKGEEWKVVARIPYRGMLLGEERVCVMERER